MEWIRIEEISNYLGLERNPRGRWDFAFYVRCPFCDDTKYHMQIHTEKNVYRCNRCGTGGGALDLYSRVMTGSPCIPGVNSKEIYKEVASRLDPTFESKTFVYSQNRKKSNEIDRASDDEVHKTYDALLNLPEFKLRGRHIDDLLARGLPMNAIRRNQYGSFFLDESMKRQYLTQMDWNRYNNQISDLVKDNSRIMHFPRKCLLVGLAIAKKLEQCGCTLKGVPGFFKVGSDWCFRVEEGLYIPTRNDKGEIVALQVRKDQGSLRYMTISSNGFPNGVTKQISRLHYPLGNAPAGPQTRVILTEGPLKADVAISLLGSSKPYMFIALHGVNNTGWLDTAFDKLKSAGINAVINGLDMDKCTNPNVARASDKIKSICDRNKLTMCDFFWDTAAAAEKEREFEALCKSSGLRIPDCENAFQHILAMAMELERNQVEVSTKWDSSSKGLDDFLLTKKWSDSVIIR